MENFKKIKVCVGDEFSYFNKENDKKIEALDIMILDWKDSIEEYFITFVNFFTYCLEVDGEIVILDDGSDSVIFAILTKKENFNDFSGNHIVVEKRKTIPQNAKSKDNLVILERYDTPEEYVYTLFCVCKKVYEDKDLNNVFLIEDGSTELVFTVG